MIFRWDFDLSPGIIDRTGEILKELKISTRWQELQENWGKRTFILKHQDDDGLYARSITFNPNSAVFNSEWAEGVSLQRLLENAQLMDLFHDLEKIKAIGGMSSVGRCGMRLLHLNRLVDESVTKDVDVASEAISPMLGTFLSTFCSAESQPLAMVAGPVQDVMVRYVGRHADEVGYTVSFGPYANVEFSKYFETIGPSFKERNNYDFICDTDFHEENFTLSVSPKSWATPLVDRLQAILKSIEQKLSEKRHG